MFDKRLLVLVPDARRFIVCDVLLMWIALLANIALFFLIGLFLQEALHGTFDAASIVSLLSISFLAIVVRMLCQTAAQVMGQKAALIAKRTVRSEVYDKLVSLGTSYCESVATAEATQVCVEGCEQLEGYFGQYLPQFFYAMLAPVTLFAALAPVCLPAAVVLLVCVPLIPLSIVAVQKIARRVMRGYWGSYTDLGQMFLESIQGLTTLKIYQADEARHQAMNAEAENFRRATMRLLRMQLNSVTVMDLFAYGGAALGIIVTLFQFAKGSVDIAGAFTVVFLSVEFFLPLRTLGSFFHTAMGGMAVAEKIYGILDIPEKTYGTRIINAARADIEVRKAGYSYGDGRKVLKDVDFKAAGGSFIGIAGESGSGKSTFAGVLSGINADYTGEVFVGGIDLREISAASLRDALVTVAHDSYLFKGTVRSNLLMAKPAASDEALWGALDRVCLKDFVQAKGGLDSYVAACGSNLSGGQRQRLAVARALLHDAAIYVFDEATSNIDAESENAICAVIEELAQTRSVIMVSHRLRALRRADCIYVFEDGRVVESGTHDELVASAGSYAHMWKQQADLETHVETGGGFSAAAASDATAASGEEVEPGVAAASAASVTEVASDTPVASVTEVASDTPVASDATASASVSSVASASVSSVSSVSSAAVPSFVLTRKSLRSGISVMAHLIGLVRPLAPVMLFAIALGVAGFLAAIFLTVFASYGLLFHVGASLLPTASFACVMIAVCGIARGPLRYGEQLSNHYLAFRILALVRDRVFAALRKLAPAKLEDKDKGDLMSMATSDIELLEVFYAHTLSPVAIAIIVSSAMTAFIAAQSPVLGFFALVFYVFVGICLPIAASKFAGSLGRDMREGIAEMNTFVLDSLRGLRETLQYGRAQDRSHDLLHSMASLAHIESRLKTKNAFFVSLTGAVVMVFDIAMLCISMSMAVQGGIGFSQAVIATAALMSSAGPVVAVANLGSSLQQTLAAGARVLDILEEKPRIKDVEGQLDLKRSDFAGAGFHRVDFSYPTDRQVNGRTGGNVDGKESVSGSVPAGIPENVLESVTFGIKPGEVVQIAGKSGAGKSTLLKLLMRFWDPDRGVVEISGSDIRHVNTAALRTIESFMTQETHLFCGTIRDNLAIVDAGASEERMMAALDAAALGDFVRHMSKGLDTPIGELGATLSGGERQRLGLARIFLHDGPLILLDEPTSNLDSLSEAAVLRALAEHRKGKTIVLVSHRTSVSRIADRAYSLDRGRAS